MTFILNDALITPNIGLIFWTLMVFTLLLITLRKFAWGPITSALRAREQSIDEALNTAKKAREEVAAMRNEREEIMAQARQERDSLLKDAKEVKDKLIYDAKAQAQEEGRKILANAKESIEKEKQAAMKELREQVVSLSIEAASKILKRELSEKGQQEDLIEDYLNKVNAN